MNGGANLDLSSLPDNPTVEDIFALYPKVTGNDPTPAEIDELKTRVVMGRTKLATGSRITPDAEEANADWPKRTKDVPTP